MFEEIGESDWCAGRSPCGGTDLPDGSEPFTTRHRLEATTNGVTYEVVRVRPDNAVVLVRVSNARSLKGEPGAGPAPAADHRRTPG